MQRSQANPSRLFSILVFATSLLAAVLRAASSFAGLSGTDVYVPMAGRQAGVHPSNWYTAAWIHNPGAAAATARIYLLVRNTANLDPPWVEVQVGPGETELVDNIVETLFHREVFGALRVTSPAQRLLVTSRVYSREAGGALLGGAGLRGGAGIVRDRGG